MKTGKIAIIGANESITMLIEKAKSMGYETHVFAWKNGDPGEKAADYFYPISIDKKDEILQKCKEIGIEGVCSITSDFAAPTVNYVARGLNLTCNPESTETLARNKYYMRTAFQKAGIFTPEFCEVDESFSISPDVNLHYPVIVKPTDRWSSKAITRVDRAEDLDEAIQRAVHESINGKAIVESYMDGPEYSAECICYRGEYRILAFTKKQTTGSPNYIETGHIQPADLTAEQCSEAERVIHIALAALEIQNGAAHVEFRVLENGTIGIIEIGARMGGGYIGTDLTPISTGMDYIRMVIDIACGREPDYSLVRKPEPVAVKFIMCPEDDEKIQNTVKRYPEHVYRYHKFHEDCSTVPVDGNSRHGYCIMKYQPENQTESQSGR